MLNQRVAIARNGGADLMDVVFTAKDGDGVERRIRIGAISPEGAERIETILAAYGMWAEVEQ